jgi:hypothetical protein
MQLLRHEKLYIIGNPQQQLTVVMLGALYCIYYSVMVGTEEAKYIECRPNMTSAWARS